MCVGETPRRLLAVKLGCSDVVTAVPGGMPFFACLLRMVPLPMEKRRMKRGGWPAP
jgi:hypothetical protein